jgi:hypothetical protein
VIAMRVRGIICRALLVLTLYTAPAAAQTLGTFRWQLQPYCNVVTLTVTLNGGVYTLDGFDDQCGAGRRASVAGTAFLNPDGSIGIGLAIVTAPSGAPLHVDVALNLATIGGAWRDSTGATGTFVFNPASTSGTPRPAPIPVFAAGLVVGQSTLLPDGSFVARGIEDAGTIPASGPGLRAMWFASRGAFRAGQVDSSQWDDPGPHSAAFGFGTEASRSYGFAAGYQTRADEKAAVAMGSNTVASGQYSAALGYATRAMGEASMAFGSGSVASGDGSTVMGGITTASGPYSLAGGFGSTASGTTSLAAGYYTTASGPRSIAVGLETTASGVASIAAGGNVTASSDYSVALGKNVSTSTRSGSFIFGDNSGVVTTVPTANNQFVVRATGGVRFLTSTSLINGCEIGATTGNLVCSGTIIGSSDRNRKQDIAVLDGDEVLAKIATLPVTTWSFIEAPGVRHAGPMAQDFHAAFGLGENDTSISYTDINGINMRAIQALIEEIAKLRERVSELEATRFRAPRQ